MIDLMEHITEITGRKVSHDKLFNWLYSNKVSADNMYFRLLTASRLVREDYLASFNEFDIWEVVE